MSSKGITSRPELVIEAGRSEEQYWKDLWRYRELFYFLAWRSNGVYGKIQFSKQDNHFFILYRYKHSGRYTKGYSGRKTKEKTNPTQYWYNK